MRYDLSNPLHRASLPKRVEQLLSRADPVIVELRECKPTRTSQQNKYLHVILAYFATQYGESADYVKQIIFKRFVNADLFAVTHTDRLLGEIETLRSSRDLTADEMTTAIERFRNWSAKEAGIYIPSASETRLLQLAEIEIERNAKFL